MGRENIQLKESLRKKIWYVEISKYVWITKARWLIENELGCKLSTKSHVHYKDDNPLNCVLSNLIVRDYDNKQVWWFDENGSKILRPTPLWSKKYECCKICGTTIDPYAGGGLCSYCYYKDYRKPTTKFNHSTIDRVEKLLE